MVAAVIDTETMNTKYYQKLEEGVRRNRADEHTPRHMYILTQHPSQSQVHSTK